MPLQFRPMPLGCRRLPFDDLDVETGLRSKAIGKVIRQVRKKGKLSTRLWQQDADSLCLAIFRTPEMGHPLDEKRRQNVEFVSSRQETAKLANGRPDDDLIVVPLGSFFAQIKSRLLQLQKGD